MLLGSSAWVPAGPLLAIPGMLQFCGSSARRARPGIWKPCQPRRPRRSPGRPCKPVGAKQGGNLRVLHAREICRPSWLLVSSGQGGLASRGSSSLQSHPAARSSPATLPARPALHGASSRRQAHICQGAQAPQDDQTARQGQQPSSSKGHGRHLGLGIPAGALRVRRWQYLLAACRPAGQEGFDCAARAKPSM